MFGKELAEDREFISTLHNFFQVCSLLGIFLTYIPSRRLRDLISKPIVSLYGRRKWLLVDKVSSVIERRMDDRRQYSDDIKRMDGLEWVADFLNENPEILADYPPQKAAQELMHNIMAGNSGTVNFIVQMLYQILQTPEYLEPLRQEANHSITKYGWNEKLITSLPLQDSFFREVNRIYMMFTRILILA